MYHIIDDVKEKEVSGSRCVGGRPALQEPPHTHTYSATTSIRATHSSVFKKQTPGVSNASYPTTLLLQNATAVTAI